jgi:hypothetical protein
MLGDDAVSEATSRQELGSVIPMTDPGWESGQSAGFPAGGVLTIGGAVTTGTLGVATLAEVFPAGVSDPPQPENARAAGTRTRNMETGSRIIGRP